MRSASSARVVRIGVSGWVYSHWRERFYPQGVPPRRWLAHIASRFATVEVNASFYRLQSPPTFDRWRAEVPRDFVFAIKGSRYITHMLKLTGGTAPLGNFFAQGVLRLGAQLGPILWQLPPMLRFDRDRAARFFDSLPRDIAAAERVAQRRDARLKGRAALTAPDGRNNQIRYALEVRHVSWVDDLALSLLKSADIALVVAETAGHFPEVEHLTGRDHVYVRLHGAEQLYASGYRESQLAGWARRIDAWSRAGRNVYVYFDNDGSAHAPADALRLQELMAKRHGASIANASLFET